MTATSADTRFTVFGFSWALVLLFGMQSERMANAPATIALCVVCGIALVFPRSPLALGGACLSYVLWTAFEDFDVVFVHAGFDWMGCVATVLALVLTVHRDFAIWRERFVDAFAPVAIAQTAVCFFAAGFAKLNTDYLDVSTSCGAVFYAHQITAFPYSLLPSDPWAEKVAIWLGLTTELLAPLLWLHHRTRRFGFWFGGFLLFLLGTNARARYYVFTGPFLALLSLGFDWHLVREWLAQQPAFQRAWPIVRVAWWIAVPVMLGLAFTVGERGTGLHVRWWIARAMFVVWSLGLFVAAGWAPSIALAQRPVKPVIARLVWIVALLYALHELMPYMGLRTARNFTMAGNLVINTRWTNHLLLESAPELPFNRLAVLEQSSDRTLNRRGGAAWPTWVLYDYLARHRKVTATVSIDGERMRLKSADFADRKSWLAQVLEIPQTPIRPRPNRCGHGRPGSADP